MDDRHIYRLFIAEILKEAGFLILEAFNGYEALKIMNHSTIDLMILTLFSHRHLLS